MEASEQVVHCQPVRGSLPSCQLEVTMSVTLDGRHSDRRETCLLGSSSKDFFYLGGVALSPRLHQLQIGQHSCSWFRPGDLRMPQLC